jgi:hypothetical protein
MAPRPAAAAGEPLIIAFSTIKADEAMSLEEGFLVDLVPAILLQNIQDQVSRGTGRFVELRRIVEPPSPDQPEVKEWARRHREEGVYYYIAMDLNFRPEGYVLHVQPVSLVGAETERWGWSGETETTIIGGQGRIDLEKVEEKSKEVSKRVAEIIERGPEETILCWCIQPLDDNSTDLVIVSRRLTLELPFHLAMEEKLGGRTYKIEGLRVPEYRVECIHGNELKQYSQYSYLISGEVRSTKGGRIEVSLRVDARDIGVGIPLGSFSIRDAHDENIPEKAVKKISENWKEVLSWK